MEKHKIWHSSIDEEPATDSNILIHFEDNDDVVTAYFNKEYKVLYCEGNRHSSWSEAKKDGAMWAYISDILFENLA